MSKKPHLELLAVILTAAVLTSSCSRYAVTLNNQPLYTPPPLLRNLQVTDPALQNCLTQTITDKNITRAEQLDRLSCSYGGIESLEGISQFTALRQLDISFNPLNDVSPLFGLTELKQLDIEGVDHIECSQVQRLVERGVKVMGVSVRCP